MYKLTLFAMFHGPNCSKIWATASGSINPNDDKSGRTYKIRRKSKTCSFLVLTNTNGDMVELSPTFCDNPIRVDLILW
jgi:hypothetical protein